MAFENLTDRLQMAFRKITGKSRLTDSDIEKMMREVRLSLLEADVNYRVVKTFTEEVKEKALGMKILKGMKPDQQVIKLVKDELTELMGKENEEINENAKGPTVIMLVGLQGTGKTTTAGKLARLLRKDKEKKPLLVAADVYRPAAIDQLVTIGEELSIPVHEEGTDVPPEKIAKNAIRKAGDEDLDLVVIDTAGRLHIDEKLMDELKTVRKTIKPDEILLTVDAMTGQDAVNVAKAFHESLDVTGCILTKLDGDTRGGAALSIRKVTGVPIKFAGTGEKLTEIEVFHPERMAGRILGMGDVVSLAEKAADEIDETDAMSMMEKMMSGTFNYDDLLKQLKWIKRLGAFSGIMKMLPGMKKMADMDKVDDKQLVYIQAMIDSMTKEERKNPKLISMSSGRRRRIANGAGVSSTEVNRLVRMLEKQQKMMRRMGNMDPDSLKNMTDKMGGDMPSGMPGMPPFGKNKK